MKKVIIAFGLPCAGKTTFWKRFLAENNNYSYVCPDILDIPAKDLTVWPETLKVIADGLQEGHDIFLEAAAASLLKNRKYFIKFLREKGAKEIVGFYFPISLARAKKRNNKRKKPRPDETIEEMNNSLQNYPPVLEDGFDDIKIIEQVV